MWSYFKPIRFLILFLLALYLINFFNYGYFIGYLLTPFVLVNKDFLRKNLDFNLLILALFTISYAMFYAFQAEETRGMQYILIYAITPPTFYILGKYLIYLEFNDRRIFYLLFGCSAIFSFTGVFSVFPNFLEGGFAQIERNLPDFWTGEIIPATLMGSYFTFNMCIPALIISYQGKISKLFSFTSLGLFTISLICVLRLGSRTQLAIFLFSSMAALIYTIPRQSLKKNVILFLLLICIVFYISSKISFDLDADWLTTFAGRMEDGGSSIASGGGRMERWTKSLEYLFTHPIGWSVKEFGFSHNLWLDAARVSGTITFLLLTLFSYKIGRQVFKTLHLNNRIFPLNIILLVYGVGFFLILSVEPILDGMFPLFCLFCLYAGILNRYYSNVTEQ